MVDVGHMTPEQIAEAFLPVDTVAGQLLDARGAGRPYSLVRIGDGENAVLSQLVGEEYRERWWTESDHRYCGLTLPNQKALEEIIHACRSANVVGVLCQDEDKWWLPMTRRAFLAADIRPRQIMYAFDNLALAEHPGFLELLAGSHVAILGRTARDLAGLLAARDIPVSLTLAVDSHGDIPGVLSVLRRARFDVCLAACGVNAVIIAHHVAEHLGRIGIDMGSASDRLLGGSLQLWGDRGTGGCGS